MKEPQVKGIVTEVLPNTLFRVKLENEKEIIAYTHLQEKILYDVNLDGILE